ncbi:hypothetical protein NEOKW01_1338 [Nematocida sp. AWRm80]|nr:hypothetical protein NEOKW01_1338 [Nematocida sp. AWRm80]
MRYKIYICIVITVLYVQLYRQSSRTEEIEEKKPDQSINIETDKYIQERAIDSTNRYIQPNMASWQRDFINRRYMYYRYMLPIQYNQYRYPALRAWPIGQNNIYNPYYSANPIYNRNISRKRTSTEQTPNTAHNPETRSYVNIGHGVYIPYNVAMAGQSSIDRAIAGTSADDIAEISKGTDNLLDIKNINKYIHIEENAIVIDLYILYEATTLAIVREQIKKHKGNIVYIQYTIKKHHSMYISECINAVCEMLDKFSTVVIWKGINRPYKTDQTRNPNTLLEKFNDMRRELQQFTERTDKYMDTDSKNNNMDNKDKKRIVLYNLSIRCIYRLIYLIEKRSIISCYLTRYDGSDYNIKEILDKMKKIHMLDIVTISNRLNHPLVTCIVTYNDPLKNGTGAAIKTKSYTNIDKINNIDSSKDTNPHPNTNQDKKSLLSAIAYLSLMDRLQNMNGIVNIQYMVDKVTERLDLSYLLWTQIIREKSLLRVPAHTLVIYTTISKEKKTLIHSAHKAIWGIFKNILNIKVKNEKTEHTKKESSNITINKSGLLHTNVSGAECIKWIIVSYKAYAHNIFPKLKTLIIYTYESDREVIEANIEKWVNSGKQMKQGQDKILLQQIEKLEEIQIYFVPDRVKSDSTEILAPEYTYNDKIKSKLECLCCSRDKNGIFTKSTPKETNTKTYLIRASTVFATATTAIV